MEKSWLAKIFSSRTSKPGTVATDADHTDAAVQFSLGLQCATGAGAAQDYAQAAIWYRQAAEQDHALAQFNLGTMYANGQGIPQDVPQSVIWYGRAANLGDAGGQYKMGRICQRASMDGSPADAPEARIEAYKWFRLAADQGYKDSAVAHETLTLNMTRADVTEAIQRVDVFSAAQKSKSVTA